MTDHPVATFFCAVAGDIDLHSLSSGVILALDSTRQLRQVLNSLRLHELLIVQMVKQYVQALLSILDMICIR